jgi:hypothetical protein
MNARPLPTWFTSGDGFPAASRIELSLTSTISTTTFVADTREPSSSVCGTVPCARSHAFSGRLHVQ